MIKYLTLPGDTLEKISSDLKIENPNYIKGFHHQYSSLFDPLDGILKTGTLLCLPFCDEIKKLNQEIIENGDNLYYHPPQGKIPFEIPLLAGTYTIHHQQFRDDESLAAYEFNMTLEYLKYEEENHIFTIELFDFNKDGIESDNKTSDLAIACMKIIYPLEISINKKRQLIEVGLHTPPLQLKNELEALKKYFTDQYAASYIDQLKLIIEDKKQLLEKLKNTLPIHFLLGSFYSATYGDWTDSEIYPDYFPWLVNASPISLELYNRMAPKDEDHDLLKIFQKGNYLTKQNLTQLDPNPKDKKELTLNKSSKNCFHEAEYHFHRTDLSVQKIKAKFSLQIDDITEHQTFTLVKV